MRQKRTQTNAVATSRTTAASVATRLDIAELGERRAEQHVPVEATRIRKSRVAARAPLVARRERAGDSRGERTRVVGDDLGSGRARELLRVGRNVRQHDRQAGRDV